MKIAQHPFSPLEQVLQKTLHRVEPPQPFVRGLGHKIRSMPQRALLTRPTNGLTFLVVILIGALLMGTASLLLVRLLRRNPPSP